MKTFKVYSLLLIDVIAIVIALILLFLLSSYTSHIGDIPSKRDKNIIVWKSDYKLKIEDFTSSNYIEGGAAANAATGIYMFKKIVNGKYQVVAFFDKERSRWNSSKIVHSDWILNHEQRHFDITEIVVRDMNKELSVTPKSLVDYTSNKYWHILDSIQSLYDDQTAHSMDSTSQVFWNNKIDKLLNQ